MVLLVGRAEALNFGFPKGKETLHLFRHYLCRTFLVEIPEVAAVSFSQLVESFTMKVKEVDRTANIAWSPQPQV